MNLSRQHVSSGSRAFTLLELIGVLAILAILLATAAPITVQMIRSQRQASDTAYLPIIAEALKRGMLREQRFPADDQAAPTGNNSNAWWRLAARHGAGSENEVRYPPGEIIGGNNPRRLFLAVPSWAEKTFYEVTGNPATTDDPGLSWMADMKDPQELRMLLLSSANPDLPLPASLQGSEFDKFWSDWSVGNTGNPAIGSLTDYGLGTIWTGRATELNIERIDLRDWLCHVVIENRRHLDKQYDSKGNLLAQLSLPQETYLADPLPEVGTYNLDGVRVALKLGATSSSGGQDEVELDELHLLQPGRLIDEESPAGFIIAGQQQNSGGETISSSMRHEIYNPSGTESIRAPIALINPLSNAVVLTLTWETTDAPIQDRYFLKTQELLLGEPWSGNEVGAFIITENYSTLSFDGLVWRD